MPSLFQRSLAYLPGQLMDPRENRLTEALASVLARVPGLATALVREWLPTPPASLTWSEQVATQRRTRSGKIVDLEIRLTPLGASSPGGARQPLAEKRVVVWVEVKFGADLGEDQLKNYVADLRIAGGETTHLQLLAPRGFDYSGDEAAFETWQSLARRVLLFRRGRGRDLDAVQIWLLDQLLDYLKEEGLMDRERLDAQDAFVASAVPQTLTTLLGICDAVRAHLAAEWHAPVNKSLVREAWNSYWTYPVDRDGEVPFLSGEAYLEWGMRDDSTWCEHPRHAFCFYAGITVPRNHILVKSGEVEFVAALGAHGFERGQDAFVRLYRYRYLDDVLQYGSLQEQTDDISAWVLGTFRHVRDAVSDGTPDTWSRELRHLTKQLSPESSG